MKGHDLDKEAAQARARGEEPYTGTFHHVAAASFDQGGPAGYVVHGTRSARMTHTLAEAANAARAACQDWVTFDPSTEAPTLQTIVKAHVLTAIEDCKGNRTKAAKLLGIDRRTIYRMLDAWSVR
jgi:DNA-binding NtrC family response regulator